MIRMPRRAVQAPASPWRKLFAVLAAVVLIVPLLAMQFTDEVNWGAEDFAAALALLAGTWLAVELVWRMAAKSSTRLVATAVVFSLLVVIWAELAGGVF
jgi:uncharacterized membrane protein YfcA